MIPQPGLLEAVCAGDLRHWEQALAPAIEAARRHGNRSFWQEHYHAMPEMTTRFQQLDADCVVVGTADELQPTQRSALEIHLKALQPWRKGPFCLFGTTIEAEWRSDWKWRRIRPALDDVAGKRVLDVGCGNGYYALRLAGLGAEVIGIEPHMLYVAQFIAVTRFLKKTPCWILPCTLETLPPAPVFDTVLSMGVIYHRRSPLEHLLLLKEMLKPGGRLILESIVIDGDEHTAMVPPQRYARMRNVWFVPSRRSLQRWLHRTGFTAVTELHHGVTSTQEQRRTDWMTHESLADGLDSACPALTVEGLPAPQRVVITAEKAEY